MMHMCDACLQHFERRQGRPLAQEVRQKIEKVFNTPANYVLSNTAPPFPPFASPTVNYFHSFTPHPHPDTPQHNQFYYRAERDLRGFLALDAAAARGNMAVRRTRVAHCIVNFAFCILHFAFCILHFAFCILHFTFCILHCALNSPRRIGSSSADIPSL